MLPQLDPTWYASQLFWLAVAVVAMHLALTYWVLPRLTTMIDGRDTFKRVAVSEAESFRRSAEEVLTRYEQALADARARSQQVLAEADGTIRTTAANTHAQMEQTVAARVKDAHAQLREHTQVMRAELEASAGDLVADVVARFTSARPDGTKTASALKSLV